MSRKELRRKAVGLFSSGLGGQMVSMGMLALLARLSTPDEFGHLALYQSIVGLSVLVGSLRYELAVPAVRGDRAAANLTVAAFALSVATGVIVFTCVVGLKLGGASLPTWSWLLGAGIWAVCLTNAAVHVAIRFGEVLPLHLARWGKGSVTAIGATIGLIAIGGPTGLVGGAVVGQMTVGGGILWTLRRRLRQVMAQASGSKGGMAALRRYREFSLLGLPQSILHTAGEMLPVFVFAMIGEVSTGGVYWLFYRGIMAVAGAGAEAAKQTVFPVLRTRVGAMDRVLPEMARWWRVSVLHGFWLSVLTGIFGPTAIEELFGKEWTAPGLLLSFLAAWAVFSVASSVVVVLVPVLQIHRKYLEFEVLAFATRFTSLMVGILVVDHDQALIVFAGVSMLLTALKGIWLLKSAVVASSKSHALTEQLA